MSEYRRRNIIIKGRRTSISLESTIWSALDEICERENMTFGQICELIDDNLDRDISRTSAVRSFIVNYYRTMVNDSEILKSGSLNLNGGIVNLLTNSLVASK